MLSSAFWQKSKSLLPENFSHRAWNSEVSISMLPLHTEPGNQNNHMLDGNEKQYTKNLKGIAALFNLPISVK